MNEYVDFFGQVSLMRENIYNSIKNLFIGHQIKSCQISDTFITTIKGNVEIMKCIYKENEGLYIIDEFDAIEDLTNLQTEDMIAIYDSIWYELMEQV